MEPLRPIIADVDEYLFTTPVTERAEELLAAAKAMPPAPPHRVNGLFSRKHRLPADCKHLAEEMQAIQEQLEAAVIEKHGQVGIYHAAVIESVLTHHKRLRLLQRWLVRPKHVRPKPWETDEGNRTEDIDLSERVKLLDGESKATDARNKAILSLGLGGTTTDDLPWAKIFEAGMKVAGVIDASKAKPTEGD